MVNPLIPPPPLILALDILFQAPVEGSATTRLSFVVPLVRLKIFGVVMFAPVGIVTVPVNVGLAFGAYVLDALAVVR